MMVFKNVLDIFNKDAKIECIAGSLKGFRRNWDYEVISHSIMDDEANDYHTMEEVFQHGKNESDLVILEEDTMEGNNDEVCFRFEKNDTDDVNLLNAKKCGFGVLRMLKGKHEGKQFMFPITNYHVRIELVAYGVLTHDYMEESVKKQIRNSEVLQDILLAYGREVYDKVMKKVNEKIH